MSAAPSTTVSELERVAAELRDGDRFLLTTHEGPDGDALGSLLALHELLGQMGKDSVMFMAAKEFPLPVEYRFLPLTDAYILHNGEPPFEHVVSVVIVNTAHITSLVPLVTLA